MRFLIALLCLTLAGCSASQRNEKLSTPADREIALKVIAALRSGDIDQVKADFEPELFSQTTAIKDKTKAAMPAQGAPVLVTVSSNSVSAGADSQTSVVLNYQLGAEQRWAIVQIVLRKAQGRTMVAGWHAVPVNREPTSIGNFELTGKSAANYLWLAAMIGSTATILCALWLLAFSKGLKRRWLWVLGSMVGLGQFTLNWATGEWRMQPLAFSLLGSAAVRPSPFDPWMLSFSLPVVAAIFLFRRRSLMAKSNESEFG